MAAGIEHTRPSSMGYLMLYLHGGKHLPKMDPLLGKIDAYAKVTLVDPNNESVRKSFQTKVKPKDYNPKWKKKWEKSLKKFSTYPRIEIELWDQDPLSKDDYGGKATIELGKFGFSGTHPLVKAKVPIALAPKLKPSGDASESVFIVTVGVMPDYGFAKHCLEVAGRPHEGDGSKRISVPLEAELGPGTELIVEFEGKKVDLFLIQTEAAESENTWTELAFAPDVDGTTPAFKIRRESLKKEDEDTWKLKGKRVETAKKMDDLDIWTPWNRITLRSFKFETILEKTHGAIHNGYLKPEVDPTLPATFEEILTQLEGGAFGDKDKETLYYPIPERQGDNAVAFLTSTFNKDGFDRAVWLFTNQPQLFVDLMYEGRRKRTEIHYHKPKLVQSKYVSMRVSVDDLDPTCGRSKMLARIMRKDFATLREVQLPAVLPGVFTTYGKKKKTKDFDLTGALVVVS